MLQKDEELILYSDLKVDLEREEFFLVYQPQVSVESQKVIGLEALIRWQHPQRGLTMPDRFIYIAEEGHLISQIGQWVLETAAKQYQEWRNQVKGEFSLCLSVNVSAQQLKNNNFFLAVKNILENYKIPQTFLKFELTESIFIEDAENIIEKLEELKKLGILIAIDDFGKGYSALSYLNHLPIDCLKLDISFIEKNIENTPDAMIVQSIINLARSLNLTVIAEGVEKKEQFELLKKQKCNEIQGYYFYKPLLKDNISSLISNDDVLSKKQHYSTA